MRILFDQGTPAPLRRHLHPNTVDTTAEMGWSTATKGELIKLAEDNGYEVLVTNGSESSLSAESCRTQDWYCCFKEHFLATNPTADSEGSGSHLGGTWRSVRGGSHLILATTNNEGRAI